MTKSVLTAVAFALTVVAWAAPQSASAQSEVLAELYGRGVHAYYSGDAIAANELLTMAIDNGSQDPRAYYFRGLVLHDTGRADEAKADWKKGAELEASGKAGAAIGRSLSRFQGLARLELESIRQTARLKAMATAAARSKARYGEIEQAQARVLRRPPQAATPPVTPPPAGAVAEGDDPFADDEATGQPTLQSDDALKGAMKDPFAGQPAAAGAGAPAAADAGDPFGGGAAAGGDPFGGGGDAGGDPFGGGGDAGGDPFGGGGDAGGDPFGDDSGDAPMEDPFGGDPFGS